jgi:hypothetical protein
MISYRAKDNLQKIVQMKMRENRKKLVNQMDSYYALHQIKIK